MLQALPEPPRVAQRQSLEVEGKWAKPQAGVGGRGCDLSKAERVKASGLEAVRAPLPPPGWAALAPWVPGQ